MTHTRDYLTEISQNICNRINDRKAANRHDRSLDANETHWLIVLAEELDLIEEEAAESQRLAPESYRAGYDQGWGDAIRMIIDARYMFDREYPDGLFDLRALFHPCKERSR